MGTFSSRFSSYVGVSPTTYRRLGGHLPEPAAEPDRDGEESTSIRGRVLAPPADRLGPVFVGLLRHPLPQGRPIRPTVLSAPGPYALRDVPPGTWYLLAYAMTTVGGEESTGPSPVTRRQYVGSHGPINVRPAAGDIVADVRLRPKRMLDPPVLTALPDLGARALSGRGGGPCHHGCSSAGRARRR